MRIQKTIFTGFAPNLTAKDTTLACRMLFTPWKWSGMECVLEATRQVSAFYDRPTYLCDSGRSALFLTLKTIGIEEKEVLVQAFTCLVVINAIRAAGGIPVYVDIDRTYNMDPTDANKKITTLTKVIIFQHTFGIPAQTHELMKLAKANGIAVIEDCAHAIGATNQNQKLGTIGDMAIISFGADKVISCARGGGIIVNNNVYEKSIANKVTSLPHVPYRIVLQHLLYYPFFYIGKRWYSWGIGKALLWFAHTFHIISRAIYPKEKRGRSMNWFPTQFSNALAPILLSQLKELQNIILHRQKIAKVYEAKLHNPHIVLPLKEKGVESGSIYLRYPILVDQPYKLYLYAKKREIILGNWYDAVVSPRPEKIDIIQYTVGSCPIAERISKQSVNLPTDVLIGEKETERIIQCLNSYRG